jgi:2-phosphoglycolate phosphatase
MIRAVLFDLDGTLIDTAADFIRILQQMCREKGVPELDTAVIRAQVSEGARAMVKLVYPELSIDDPFFLQQRQVFLQRYAENIAVDSALFADMQSLLLGLEQQHIPWGIVTNKPRWLSEALLAALDLNTRCAVLVCPEDVRMIKPDPEPLLCAAQQLNLDPQQLLYVGDHPRDIDAGRAAQMTTIVAAYGYLPPADKDNLAAWRADFIVHNVLDLHKVINSLI